MHLSNPVKNFNCNVSLHHYFHRRHLEAEAEAVFRFSWKRKQKRKCTASTSLGATVACVRKTEVLLASGKYTRFHLAVHQPYTNILKPTQPYQVFTHSITIWLPYPETTLTQTRVLCLTENWSKQIDHSYPVVYLCYKPSPV